jgi:hypothetical protein
MSTIDQEGTIRACGESEKKMRKRTMIGSSRDNSSGAPPEVPHDLHTTHGTVTLTSATVLGQPPVVLAATTVQPHPSSTTRATGGSQATTAVHTSRVPIQKLWEGWTLCQGLPLAEVGQFTMYSSSCGKPTERPSTTIWPCQLHRCGGDTHRRGSTCGYVHPQRVPYHYIF